MIASESPVVLELACKLFIGELALRSWNRTEELNKKVLQKSDIVDAISKSEMYDCK